MGESQSDEQCKIRRMLLACILRGECVHLSHVNSNLVPSRKALHQLNLFSSAHFVLTMKVLGRVYKLDFSHDADAQVFKV